MCFYHDYDWYADIQEEAAITLTETKKCDECRRPLNKGELVHYLYQQEHEECQACEYGECSCETDRCCQCIKPEYGETTEYYCCEECKKFLKAVEAVEVEEGCSPADAQPSLCGAFEEIRYTDNAKKYVRKALALYPELRNYLARNWKHIS